MSRLARGLGLATVKPGTRLRRVSPTALSLCFVRLRLRNRPCQRCRRVFVVKPQQQTVACHGPASVITSVIEHLAKFFMGHAEISIRVIVDRDDDSWVMTPAVLLGFEN